MQALIDSGSKVNAMSLIYAKKLEFQIWKTDIGIQKINGSTLSIFEIVIADFQVQDKLERAKFFQKTFLVTYTNMKVIFRMFFLTFSNANVGFLNRELI